MDLTTFAAGSYAPSPSWDAVIVQVPVGDALGDAIATAIAGKSDPRSALNEAQSRIKKIHKDHSK
jgi:ABC-type glycerol-3-phosphate transport system substrate-binding protein